jgi:hypothetical protein
MKVTVQYRHSMAGSLREKVIEGPAVSVGTMDDYTVIKAGEVSVSGTGVGVVRTALYVRTVNVCDIVAENEQTA